MDAIYVVGPFWNTTAKRTPPPKDTSPKSTSARANTGVSLLQPHESPYHPSNRQTSGMGDPDDLISRYSKITGYDPRLEGHPPGKDWEMAKIFHSMRGGVISHGIQARTYAGQASSDFSHIYFENTRRSFDGAWDMVQQVREKETSRSRL
jgi:hypothetical protein